MFETDTNKLYIGDGTSQAKNLSCITMDTTSLAKLDSDNSFDGKNTFNNDVEITDAYSLYLRDDLDECKLTIDAYGILYNSLAFGGSIYL